MVFVVAMETTAAAADGVPPPSVLPPSTSDTESETVSPEFTRCAQLCWWCIRDVQASAEIDSKVVRRRVRQCCWNSGHPWWLPRHWHVCAQCCDRALDAPGGRVKVINYKGERAKIGPPGFSDEDDRDCSDKQQLFSIISLACTDSAGAA